MIQSIIRIVLVIEYVPPWLGPSIFGAGMLLIIYGMCVQFEYKNNNLVDENISGSFEAWIASSFGFATLAFISVVAITIWESSIFALGFSAIGRYIEGISTGYSSNWISRRRSQEKVINALAIFSSIFWIVLSLISLRVVDYRLSYYVLLLWTLWVVVVSAYGFSVRISQTRNSVPGFAFVGLILCVVGAEIFNLTTTVWIIDIIISYVSYIIGYSRIAY